MFQFLMKILKNLENQYRNLKCILTGGNKGYAVANNIGLKSVKTNYALVLKFVVNNLSYQN